MATVYTTAVSARADTLSNFKAWASLFFTVLAAGNFNWTRDFAYADAAYQTGSSGTFADWTVIDQVPTAEGQVYEIYAMNDGAAQSGCPFYMRLDYYYDGQLKLKVRFGRGHSSGTMTGTNGESYSFEATENNTATTYNLWFSGTTNRFAFSLWNQYAGQGWFCTIERSKDSTGADTYGSDDFVNVMLLGNGISATTSNQSAHIILPQNGTVPNAQSVAPVIEYEPTTAAFGTDVALFPLTPVWKKVRAPLLNYFVTKAVDFTALDESSISVTHYGSSRTFKVLNNSAFVRAMFHRNDSRIAMRYE